jgi:uncharacterized Tic20 family protein
MTESNVPPPASAPTAPASTPEAGGGALDYGKVTKGPQYLGPTPSKEESTQGMLIYILGIVTGFIGPLILWLLKKEQSAFVNDQGKEVLNFQITTFIAYIICFLLSFVVIGIFLMPVVFICYIIFMIMGAIKANKGIAYRFPFALRLIK